MFTLIVSDENTQFVTALHPSSWQRSIRAMGGFWQGTFNLTESQLPPSVGSLQDVFNTWLGYHLVERYGGITTWEGMIYELDLSTNGVRRRRTLDLLANAVRTTYATQDFDGDNLLGNPGFELLGNGGDDVFAGWVEGGGASQVGVESASPYSGSYSCYVTSTGNLDGDGHCDDAYIRQNVSVTPGRENRLTFWTRGSGSSAGRFSVRDPNASEWIVPPQSTGVAGLVWQQVSVTFAGPSEKEVLIFLYGGTSSGQAGWFDEVEVLEKIDVVRDTSWKTNDQSIARYGRKEEWLESDEVPLATAEQYRDTYLSERGWPWARPVGLGQSAGEAELTVRAAGYVFTASWRYVTAGDGSTDNVSSWISELVTTDCDFLTVGNIATNTLQVTKSADEDAVVWDTIQRMVRLGGTAAGGGAIPWRFWVDVGRLAHYQQVDTTPRYYLRGGRLYDRAAGNQTVVPWTVHPGVVRDMDYPIRGADSGSFLASSQDIWIEEVKVYADGRVALMTGDFSEADILAAQADLTQY